MPSCFVCGRTRNQNSKQDKITFHRFPTDVITREKWYEFLLSNSLPKDKVTQNSLICSEHFASHNFVYYNRKTILNKTAVPSICVARVKSAKLLFPETRTPIRISGFQVTASSSGLEDVVPLDDTNNTCLNMSS
ncbi:hypothetical protein ACI65C_013748 [Semiaphis heraclei]